MHGECRVGVGGRPGVGEAAALVDGNVDEHASRLHARDEVVADELGRLGAWYENGADDHVGGQAGAVDLEAVGCHGAHPTGVERIQFAQALQVGVEHDHLGAEPDCNRNGVRSGDTAAQHDDGCRIGSGNPGNEQPRTAVRLEHRVGADDGSKPTGDLAHRGEKRKCAGGQLHGLVGDRRDPRREQRVGEGAVGGEVKVGEQHEVLAQVAVLRGDRLLHLEQQFGARPGGGGIRSYRRAGGHVLVVGNGGSETCAGLDHHIMTVGDKVVNSCRGDRDAELVVLDLFRNGHLHAASVPSGLDGFRMYLGFRLLIS